MQLDLAGKTALVCGASQGIGLGAARELALLNCNVILLARSEERLTAALSSLAGNGKHDTVACDMANLDALRETARDLVQRHGSIEILVNNTGGPPGGTLENATTEQLQKAFDQHVLAAHVLAQALLPGMKAKKFGRIINIISTSVKIPIPQLGVSNTIRGAHANWAKTLATELGGFGITVNNILPGFIETARHAERLGHVSKASGKTPELVAQEWLDTIPARRFGHIEETGAAVAFLASPAGAYINGINLPVDGGRLGCL